MPIETCSLVELPAVTADFCNPSLNFGQIDRIYLGNEGNPLVDWTDLVEWNLRLDNDTLADPTLIRMLHVVGDKPAPERNKIDFSQGRSVYSEPKHTINFRIDETDDNNYALIQFLEENAGSPVRVWYQAGQYLYGGNEGVQGNITLDDIIPENDEELNTFNGVIFWEGSHPDRIVNPLA